MLRTAIAFRHTGKVDRDLAPRRETVRVRRHFFGGCYYALIRRPYNDCLPGSGGKRRFNHNKARRIATFTLNSQV
jgi:hypothetical protein